VKDLKNSIKNVLSYGAPIILHGQLHGIIINQKFLDILRAEYNIHFVEPEDEQLEFPDYPTSVHIDNDNIKIRSWIDENWYE